jgi:hypothetical protein
LVLPVGIRSLNEDVFVVFGHHHLRSSYSYGVVSRRLFVIHLYDLSPDEQVALMQIDLMKREITSIDKTTNPDNTSVTYALSKNLENTAHDDRFYCAILLAHQLYDMRRGVIIGAANPDEWADTPVDVGKHRNIMAGGCVSPLAL